MLRLAQRVIHIVGVAHGRDCKLMAPWAEPRRMKALSFIALSLFQAARLRDVATAELGAADCIMT